MRDLLDELDRWRAAGRRVALARVVGTAGSAPRGPGAAMAVTEDGEVAGSVSGGCVEGAVVEAALEALETGERQVISFGYSDSDAFAVGLTCGGTVRLFVEPHDAAPELVDGLAAAVRDGTPAVLLTRLDTPDAGAKLLLVDGEAPVGTLGDRELDRVATRDAAGELAAGRTRIRHYGPRGQAARDDVAVFVESFVPPPRMVVVGAVDFASALAQVAKVLGYHVTVVDARPVFATPARFPTADDVVVDWPHRLIAREGASLTPRDAVCVLTHDAKFDVPAIVAALGTTVGYVGAMGSRRTHGDRVQRLREAGVDDAGLARLHAPIGLDLGAVTPEETAISICAEIITARGGREVARSLTAGNGPIHRLESAG